MSVETISGSSSAAPMVWRGFKRSERVLEHHLDFRGAARGRAGSRPRRRRPSIERRPPLGVSIRVRSRAKRRLARSGFADDGQCLARLQIEARAGQRPDGRGPSEQAAFHRVVAPELRASSKGAWADALMRALLLRCSTSGVGCPSTSGMWQSAWPRSGLAGTGAWVRQ